MARSGRIGVTIGAAAVAALLAPAVLAGAGLFRDLAPQQLRPRRVYPANVRTVYTPDTEPSFTTAALTPMNPTLAAPPVAPPPSFGQLMRTALSDYASGNLKGGDAVADEIGEPVARTALEWAALHAPTGIPFVRYADFLSAHPNWPAADWARREAEEALWRDPRTPQFVFNFFAHRQPETPMGKLALARALLETGAKDQAGLLARRVWRRDELFPSLETEFRAEFGSFLTAEDDARRADRLLYEGDVAAGLRAAAHAGKDELALARVLAAVDEHRASPAVMKSAPKSMRADPAYLFAEISHLEAAKKIEDAARAMLSAPRDPQALIDPDAWWALRRRLARQLLDLGQAKSAYALCSAYVPGDKRTDLGAEFLAGWIALRFLRDPQLAEPHFAKLAALAGTPVSKARGEYWLGRDFEAQGARSLAKLHFRAAATFPQTYYGQLADAALGVSRPHFGFRTGPAATGDPAEATRVVTLLEAYGDERLAYTLAIQTAHSLTSPAQLAALADVGEALEDARLTLTVGKIAARRGFNLMAQAFPTFGVPTFAPLATSAPLPVVYAVARQESSFRVNALSSAGAHGVMQMIVSTARQTARRFDVPFTAARLEDDPAFNAQLGAAHLGMLLRAQRGSLILTFAAYNAGERRVDQWIKAYGDPRRPGVDPVDWVERIPFAQTRDYVERVMENYVAYEARFADRGGAPSTPAAPAPGLPLTPVGAPSPSVPPISLPQAKL